MDLSTEKRERRTNIQTYIHTYMQRDTHSNTYTSCDALCTLLDIIYIYALGVNILQYTKG